MKRGRPCDATPEMRAWDERQRAAIEKNSQRSGK
jgi:hypothetical protein